MPTLGDMQAAKPKCPKGMTANIQGSGCGEPMIWDEGVAALVREKGGNWRCPAHGPQMSGREASQRAGYSPMWFEEAA